MDMPLKNGDRYRCSNPDCGCELVVTKDSKSGQDLPLSCCCGQELRKAGKAAAATV